MLVAGNTDHIGPQQISRATKAGIGHVLDKNRWPWPVKYGLQNHAQPVLGAMNDHDIGFIDAAQRDTA